LALGSIEHIGSIRDFEVGHVASPARERDGAPATPHEDGGHMTNRDYGRGGRGGPYDRDYDRGDYSERERDERWERGEHAGGRYYGRGRDYDREERELRYGSREWSPGDEWRFSRPSREGREPGWDEGGERYDRGRHARGHPRGDPRDEMSDREYGGVGSSSFGGGFGGYGPMGGGYAGSTPSGRGYGGYAGYGSGGISGYGPSAGYGYSGRDFFGGERRRQDFTGRGPKGYRRSDERIREEVNEALWRHPEIDASDVEIRVDGAEVVLIGVVEDRRMKRLVEDVAENVWGVNDVRNELKVRHGFLAALMGERVDEREVERTTAREVGATTSATAPRSGAAPARSSTT
jgi:hypothetical protein